MILFHNEVGAIFIGLFSLVFLSGCAKHAVALWFSDSLTKKMLDIGKNAFLSLLHVLSDTFRQIHALQERLFACIVLPFAMWFL